MTRENDKRADELLEAIGNLQNELFKFAEELKGAYQFSKAAKEMRKIYDTWEDGIEEENYDGPPD
jgi:hypothetical protein